MISEFSPRLVALRALAILVDAALRYDYPPESQGYHEAAVSLQKAGLVRVGSPPQENIVLSAKGLELVDRLLGMPIEKPTPFDEGDPTCPTWAVFFGTKGLVPLDKARQTAKQAILAGASDRVEIHRVIPHSVVVRRTEIHERTLRREPDSLRGIASKEGV
jgi:hypothetical protein